VKKLIWIFIFLITSCSKTPLLSNKIFTGGSELSLFFDQDGEYVKVVGMVNCENEQAGDLVLKVITINENTIQLERVSGRDQVWSLLDSLESDPERFNRFCFPSQYSADTNFSTSKLSITHPLRQIKFLKRWLNTSIKVQETSDEIFLLHRTAGRFGAFK